jgi:hypothetical protein
MGQAINIIEYRQRPQNIVSYAVSLPTLAALGWYHEKLIDKARRSTSLWMKHGIMRKLTI